MRLPNWPAVVRLAGVDELVYLADAAQWRLECVSLGDSSGDVLIDSSGSRFDIRQCELSASGTLPLGEFDAMVRAHLVAMQQCCVYKLELQSIRQGMQLVRDTVESDAL